MISSRPQFRYLAGHTVPPPLTPLEQAAVRNGWSLDNYRWACRAWVPRPATPDHQPTGAWPPPSLTGAATAIPAAPDLHARVRAAARDRGVRVAPLVGVGVPSQMRGASTSASGVPLMPDLHARVRAAAAAPLEVVTTSQPVETPAPRAAIFRPLVAAIPPTPSLHDRVRAAARRIA